MKPNGTGSTLVKVTDSNGSTQTIGIDDSVELLIPGNNSPVAADLKAVINCMSPTAALISPKLKRLRPTAAQLRQLITQPAL